MRLSDKNNDFLSASGNKGSFKISKGGGSISRLPVLVASRVTAAELLVLADQAWKLALYGEAKLLSQLFHLQM